MTMSNSHPHVRRALSARQEKKLVDYLDERFLELTRGYKKRSEPTTHLPTLSHYLESARQILSLILQIPPIDPSTSLRIAYLLRLTNDVLSSITGYPPDAHILPRVLDWLDDLDQAWLAVLQAQVWDPSTGGVDLVIDAADASAGVKSSPLTQTESTRLKSLIVGGEASLEEWLEKGNSDEPGEDELETRLRKLGLQADFDDLFARTLDFLGSLGGTMVVE
ncbi:hypothetical protein L208DRAFT_1356724 [Tricholoma matsutake]|nr:hypothetical protein L208DRAFT_1356724 [Tricholoma matsutake 945]